MKFNYSVYQYSPTGVYAIWDPVYLVDWDVRVSVQVWEVLSHYCLKFNFCTHHSLLIFFSFWNSFNTNTVCLDCVLLTERVCAWVGRGTARGRILGRLQAQHRAQPKAHDWEIMT